MKKEFSPVKFLLTISVIALSFSVFFYLKNPSHFPITQIKVGALYEHVEPQALQAAITTFVKDKNFFTMDAKGLKKTLENIPWVKSASIRRVWPGALNITIKEQAPMARWNEDSLINTEGEYFQPDVATIPGDLPKIKTDSDEDLSQALDYYKMMNESLKPFDVFVSDLNLDKNGVLKAKLSNGVQVMIGKKEVVDRWTRFIAVYPRLTSRKNKTMERVDLRYLHGFAIKWKDAL